MTPFTSSPGTDGLTSPPKEGTLGQLLSCIKDWGGRTERPWSLQTLVKHTNNLDTEPPYYKNHEAIFIAIWSI